MIGTLVNAVAVALGSSLGMVFKNKISARFTGIVFHALGVFTLFLGVKMSLLSANLLILVFSLLLGGLLGEALAIDAWLQRLGKRLEGKAKPENGKKEVDVAKGFVTAFLLFCVGSMTLLGTFQEGLRGDRSIILTKSLMDFFSSIALASALGRGVLYSAAAVLIYQGGLTLGAGFLSPFLSDAMMNEMSAAGGLMLVGLGLVILEIKEIKVANLLPGLLFAVVLTWAAEHFGFYVL